MLIEYLPYSDLIAQALFCFAVHPLVAMPSAISLRRWCNKVSVLEFLQKCIIELKSIFAWET